MRPPEAVRQLIEHLKAEGAESSVHAEEPESHMVVYNDDDEQETYTFRLADTKLLLNTPETVERFYEALGNPGNTCIELQGVEPTDEVLDKMAMLFLSVD